MTLTPFGNKLVLKKLDKEDIKSVVDFNSEKPEEAVVVAIGDDVVFNGKEIKVDDKVVYSKNAAVALKLEDQEYFIVAQDDVWAVIAE